METSPKSDRAGEVGQRPGGIWLAAATAVIGLAFGIRILLAPGIDLGMDGGVSTTLALLPVPDSISFNARDIHPPLYYLLLKGWLRIAGLTPFAAKLPGIALGVVLIAAVWSLARRIAGDRAGFVAATLAAINATAVGASLTVRDLAPGVSLALLALALCARAVRLKAPGLTVWLAVGILDAAALLTTYVAAPLLLTQALLVLLFRRSRWRGPLAGAAAVLVLSAPWMLYAAGSLAAKASGQEFQRPAGAPVVGPGEFTVRELALAIVGEFGRPDFPVAVLTTLLVVAALVGLVRAPPEPSGRPAAVAALAGGLISAAGVFAALNLWLAEGFTARYGFAPLPFLFVLIGVGAGRRRRDRKAATHPLSRPSAGLSQRERQNGPLSLWERARERASVLQLALTALVLIVAAAGLGAWINRPALPESFWQPEALVRYLDRVAGAEDAIVFTTPEQSGYYSLLSHRRLPWVHFTIGASYITDDAGQRARALLPGLGAAHSRVWVVLYQSGLPGTEPLREWLAENWWAAGREWVPDSLVLSYLTAGPEVSPIAPVVFEGGSGRIALRGLAFDSAAAPGHAVGVSLQWRVEQPPTTPKTVFVHLIGPDRNRYAQHDAEPGNGIWPFSQVAAGAELTDRHGLFVSPEAPPGDYVLQIGLYDGERRMQASTGGTAFQVGSIRIGRP